jgi:hypothetical protein
MSNRVPCSDLRVNNFLIMVFAGVPPSSARARGRADLDDVGHVKLRAVDPGLFEQLVEQLPGVTHERTPLSDEIHLAEHPLTVEGRW